jgi:hypothetical protein
MTRSTVLEDLDVVVRGELPDDVGPYARDRAAQLAETLTDPVQRARIRITQQVDPTSDRPVRAQANLYVGGRMVRAQVAGRNGHEAVDVLLDRLRDQITRPAPRWDRVSRPTPEPHEWRHGDRGAHRPPYYPRPAEEREVIRHKTFTPRKLSPDEALWEMNQFDYDFHLFTDAETGQDSVVARGGPSGYHLVRPSTLTLDQARQRLEDGGEPFVFFIDPTTKRGKVLYHRYDGHYGLITPAQ